MKMTISEITKKYPDLLNSTTWPEKFTCNFIEPGLVSYDDEGLGMCLIEKTAFDKMSPSFIGKPVVDRRDHIDGMKPADLEKIAKGYVTNVFYKDGWYWADFIVFDDKIKEDIKEKKYSVSCAYEVTDASNKGGLRNNILYDQEVLNGEYIHLAIVPNPRYNGAKILLNSVEGGCMKVVKGWFKKMLGTVAKNEISPEDTVDVDGERVSMGDIVKAMEAELEEEAKAKAAEAEPKEQEVSADSMLQIGGKEVTLQNAMDVYRKRKNKMNENGETEEEKAARLKKEAEEAKTKRNEGESDEEYSARMEDLKKNKMNENGETEEEKAAREKAEAEKKENETKKNSSYFLSLKNSAEKRAGNSIFNGPIVQITDTKRAKGVELYGPKK